VPELGEAVSSFEKAAGRLLSAATFPRSRSAVCRLYRDRTWARVAIWWVASFACLAVYAQLRGIADEGGMPVHGAGIEKTLFGSLPTLWLQRHVYTISPHFTEWCAVIVHASWFFVPPLMAIFVSLCRPHKIGSFFRWWISLEALAVVSFFLFPMRPPWMTDPAVTRIIALHWGAVVHQDSNALAAMPSLHVAFPLLLSAWFFRERWKLPAFFMLAYSAVISFEVVFSGEHYVVDVIGACIMVAGIALAARIDFSQLARRALSAAHAKIHLPRRATPTLALGPARASRDSESGQALIEFAFVFPILIVLLLSLMDFGIAVDHRDVLQGAVREGARSAAVGNSIGASNIDCTNSANFSTVRCTTVNESQGLLSPANVSVCYVDENANGNPGDIGDDVRVSATYTYKFSVGGGEVLHAMGVGVPSIDLSTSADSRLEATVSGATACT
jgi:Flp pilus assembly protein TadG